jgi:hypothetical protein
MCGGQTELRRALIVFQFINPDASVSFRNGGLVNIIVDERELKELEPRLDKLSTPHKVVSLSTNYIKNGKTYNHNLYNMVQHINASNISKVKKGLPATYFDNLPEEIDGYTKELSDLAGDDSGSYGSPKTTSITLQDSEADSAGISVVCACGTVQPVNGKTCPSGFFYTLSNLTGNPSECPCIPNGGAICPLGGQ